MLNQLLKIGWPAISAVGSTMGALSRRGRVAALLQKHLQLLVSNLCIIEIHGVISLKHRRRFMAGAFHDHRVVNTGFAHISVECMAQIMKPEIGDTGLLTGIGQRLLDLLERMPPIGEHPIVVEISKPASLLKIS